MAFKDVLFIDVVFILRVFWLWDIPAPGSTEYFYFKENDEHQRISLWCLLHMWQANHWGKTALSSTKDKMLSKLNKWDAGKLTAELCQDKLGKSFKISASQDRQQVCQICWARRLKMMLLSFRNLGWLCRQPAFSLIPIGLKLLVLYFLHTQVISIPPQITDGVED